MNIKGAIKQLRESPEPKLRRSAAEDIITNQAYNNVSLEALIHGLLDYDPGVKDICARALSGAPKEFHNKIALGVGPFISNKNIEIRNLAGDILTRIGSEALNILIQYFVDDDADNRKFACDIAGKIGNESIISQITNLLNDQDLNVITSAIEALGELKASEPVKKLTELYNKHDDIKPNIIEALGKIGSNESQQFLMNILKTEKDNFLKITCIDALAHNSMDFSIIEYLMKELPTVPLELQLIYLKTIYAIAFRLNQRIELPENFRHIAHLALYDSDNNIRAAGLIALGDSYQEADIKPLMNELTYNNPETQQLILYNLMVNSSEDVVENFFREFFLLPDGDGDKIDFLAYLSQVWKNASIKNKELAINNLLDLLSGKPYNFSSQVIELLLGIDSEKVLARIREYLNSDDIIKAEEIKEITSKLNIKELVDN